MKAIREGYMRTTVEGISEVRNSVRKSYITWIRFQRTSDGAQEMEIIRRKSEKMLLPSKSCEKNFPKI